MKIVFYTCMNVQSYGLKRVSFIHGLISETDLQGKHFGSALGFSLWLLSDIFNAHQNCFQKAKWGRQRSHGGGEAQAFRISGSMVGVGVNDVMHNYNDWLGSNNIFYFFYSPWFYFNIRLLQKWWFVQPISIQTWWWWRPWFEHIKIWFPFSHIIFSHIFRIISYASSLLPFLFLSYMCLALESFPWFILVCSHLVPHRFSTLSPL